MSDTKESMPAQPKTKELPAMTDRALLEDLARTLKTGLAEIRADVQLVATDVTVVKERVRLVEERVTGLEGRQSTASERVKGESQVNLKQDAAIASIVTTQEEHGKDIALIKTAQADNNKWTKELYDDGKKFFAKHPAIGNVVAALVIGILYVIAKKLGVQL